MIRQKCPLPARRTAFFKRIEAEKKITTNLFDGRLERGARIGAAALNRGALTQLLPETLAGFIIHLRAADTPSVVFCFIFTVVCFFETSRTMYGGPRYGCYSGEVPSLLLVFTTQNNEATTGCLLIAFVSGSPE